MWYNWGRYSFTQPLKANGKATRYLSVLALIDKEGPQKKFDLLQKVWGVKGPKELYRGHMSTTFSALHHFGVLDYNRKTYKWSLTNKGKQILENAKSVIGDNIMLRPKVTSESVGSNTLNLGGHTWTRIGELQGYPLYLCDEIVTELAFSEYHDTNWENSDVRNWLNSTFYNSLSKSDKRKIVKNSETNDSVFLLSIDEYKEFRNKISLIGTWETGLWLRSPKPDTPYSYVDIISEDRIIAAAAEITFVGVRPAVLLSSDNEVDMKLLKEIKDAYTTYKSLCNSFIENGGDEDEIDRIEHDVNSVM